MTGADKNDPIGKLQRDLLGRGIDCALERFRVPACAQLTASAGYLLCAAGAFLLAAGRPGGSFLVGVSGTLLLVLDTCGFSPLDWLGPKENRSVLVVPGTPSEEARKALFLALPLFCRLTPAGHFSREAAIRRSVSACGFLVALALPVLSGAAALRFLPPLPVAGALAGAAMGALAAGEWLTGKPAALRRNLAAAWVERIIAAAQPEARPFVLVYSGDEAEVKFFLAKYRRAILRGRGIFVEFSEGSCGPPAASVREGPFFFPYRVEAGLLADICAAGEACGIPAPGKPMLRLKSGGLAAMSRGFQAVTVFRGEAPTGAEPGLRDEHAIAWLAAIAAPRNLTGGGKGV